MVLNSLMDSLKKGEAVIKKRKKLEAKTNTQPYGNKEQQEIQQNTSEFAKDILGFIVIDRCI